MILTNLLMFNCKTMDLIHLYYSFKVMLMLRKGFIPIPKIPNIHLFLIHKKYIEFLLFFKKSNNREECSIEAAQESRDN